MYFDFLIPRRPESSQKRARGRKRNTTKPLEEWKQFVREEAAKTWTGALCKENVQLMLVYLCGRNFIDTDNIIKPIQDALEGLVYVNDKLVIDVESHRRTIGEVSITEKCPDALTRGIELGIECVYVRVCSSKPLEDYL